MDQQPSDANAKLQELGQGVKAGFSDATQKASELWNKLKAKVTGTQGTGTQGTGTQGTGTQGTGTLGGKKLKRTRRRGKKGGSFSMKWLKGKFSGSKKRKTGRKSRKHRR